MLVEGQDIFGALHSLPGGVRLAQFVQRKNLRLSSEAVALVVLFEERRKPDAVDLGEPVGVVHIHHVADVGGVEMATQAGAGGLAMRREWLLSKGSFGHTGKIAVLAPVPQ
jgi:hypothetical protein